MNAIALAENGLLPTFLIRFGIRQRLGETLRRERARPTDYPQKLLEELRKSPIALSTDLANEQHYEVPDRLYQLMLGPYLKYSCGYWPEANMSLERAELASLELVAERAQLANGQRILELGCGWGSFSLWAATRYPDSELVAVSNSNGQREWIEAQARKRGLSNLTVITADMNRFEAPGRFDRVVSIEMFEHMRNYEELLKRIRSWLVEDGLLFVHIFTHRDYAYPYDENDPDEWLAKHFFAGGLMPSHQLLSHFDSALTIDESWQLDGTHYSRSLEAWLDRLEASRDEVLSLFREVYGKTDARRWYERWRLFLLACSELFAYQGGTQWGVSHYRFKPKT